MANLNKLLVHVPSSLCDDFKNKYITAETNRDTSYDSKIVFLEKTQEIFAKGKIYSTSVLDFSSLQELVNSIKGLVGELPKGVEAKNIVDYISYIADYKDSLVTSYVMGRFPTVTEGTGITVNITSDGNGKANYEVSNSGVTSVDKTSSYGVALTYLDGKVGVVVSSGEVAYNDNLFVTGALAYDAISSTKKELIGYIDDDHSEETIYGAKSYAAKADADLYREVVSYLLGTNDNDSTKDTIWGAKAYANSLVNDAKEQLWGEKSDSWTKGNSTLWAVKNYADEEVSKVAAQIPTVSSGTGITVTPKTEGSHTKYEISTSAEVFHYKGNKLTLSALPSTDNTTGDVWSVGAEGAGSSLYAWDGDEWINIGGPNGVTGVDDTDAFGIALAKNSNGTVKVNVSPGSIEKDNDSVVTGGAVYTAMQGLINGLTAHTVTSSNDWGPIGTYVGVSVTTEKGQVSAVSTYMGSDFDTLRLNADKAIKEIESDSAYLSVTNSWGKNDGPTYCRLDLDKDALSTYVIDRIGENTKTGTSAYVNVSVTTSKGNVSEVTVAPTEDLKLAYSYAMSSVQWIREPIASWSYFKIEEGDENPTYGYKGKGFNINLNETNVVNLVKNKLDLSSSKTAYSTDHNPTAPYYVKVGVTTHNGKVQDVIVHNSQQFTTNMSKVESLNNVVNKIESKDSFLNITKSDSDYEYTAYYEFDLDEDAIFNYVADHIWEEYSA